jgi:hypothetical protein
MITINEYTGKWQSAMPQISIRPGTLVRLHDDPDAREWGDFRSVLRRQGLEVDFDACVRCWPRLKMDGYRIRRIGGAR